MRSRTPLSNATRRVFSDADWFWVVTGVHQGGGLDCSVVLRKPGSLDGGALSDGATIPVTDAASSSLWLGALLLGGIANNLACAFWAWRTCARERHAYARVSVD